MSNNENIVGVVEDGRLNILWPKQSAGSGVRMTGISMNMAVAPETQEIDLAEYEGQALLVQGHEGGAWIYDAQIIDKGGPLLALLARRQFGQA